MECPKCKSNNVLRSSPVPSELHLYCPYCDYSWILDSWVEDIHDDGRGYEQPKGEQK